MKTKLHILAAVLATSPLLAADVPKAQRAFIANRCLDCHDSETKKGNLDLEKITFDLKDDRNFARWVHIFDRVADGEMPPKKKPQPSQLERDDFLKPLERELLAAEKQQIGYMGRSVWRRLNRYEYENTLRDLLDAPWLQLRDMLPEDGESHRFNKVGEALDVSHIQIARYLNCAEEALRGAMIPQATRPATTTKRYYTRQDASFTGKYDLGGSLDRKTFPVLGNRGDPDSWTSNHQAKVFSSKDPTIKELEGVGVVVSTYEPTEIRFQNFRAPVSGRYKLRFLANSIWVAPISQKQYWQPNREIISPSSRSEPVTIYSDTSPRLLRKIGGFDAEPEAKVKELEVWLLAGETIRPDAARFFRSRPPDHRNNLATTNGMPGVSFRWMEVEGPLYDAWPTAGHTFLFPNLPVQDRKADDKTADGKKKKFEKPVGVEVISATPMEDAEQLLKTFMERALVRPVASAEVKRFLPIVQKSWDSEKSFSDAMIAGYTAVLASPSFLYMEEKPGRLDDFALAMRLSYFLWNSPPDATLRALAESGELHKPDVLKKQTERMLDDPKSRRFVDAFLDYWLDLRKISATAPDATLYPDYQLDDLLVESMIEESQLFFWALIKKNFGAKNLVASDFAVLNERLADHYGIPGVTGVALRPVKLPAGSIRGGLLTQASVLKVTANGTTTSPVLRGAWIMERILGRPVPPPPEAVPAVEPDTRGTTTIREQLLKHSNQESCAVCHRKMDPPGFALESFDVMGGFRTKYRAIGEGEKEKGFGHHGLSFAFHQGPAVDCTGELPDGRKFASVRDLKKMLGEDDRPLAENLVKQLLIFATGAQPRFADRPKISTILDASKSSGYGVRTLIHGIVQSDVFQTK